MDLQLTRQFDYLQRTLLIFLTNSTDMSEQFELLINELIQENKQTNRSPKNSPESLPSDSKSELPMASNSPQPLPKKRSAPLAASSKPPPSKRLKSVTIKDEDEDEIPPKKKSIQPEEKLSTTEKEEDINDDDDDAEDTKSKPSESRDINEFAIELGLVCNKCMVLTEEKDNRLVECHECHAKYHQKCHKPPVSTADISDPRCLWYCSKCKKLINKKQQSQPSLKETKLNSNSSSASINKSKTTEPPLTTGKKGLSNSIIDVTTGLFSFKPKSSDSMTSDNSTSINVPSISSSNSSLTNGSTTKNANGWASLATGFKEKKITPEVTAPTSSATSILSELSVLIGPSNSNSNIKRSPPSPKPLTSSSTSSFNPPVKQSTNGPTSGSLKSISSSSLSSVKSNKPSSPPILKPQLSASSLKPTPKLLPTSKTLQRISSPTPLGRQTSIVKSPPSATTPTYNRLNSSGSNSSGSNSPSSIASANAKIATGFDYDKRIKQMKKMAAEKSLTKKC